MPDTTEETRSLRALSAARALSGGLLALILYAAFAHGAVAAGDEERLQLAIAAVAVVATILGVCTGALQIAASRGGWLGLALLVAFAFWSGLTLLWSVAPDSTWIECNRVATYAIVLVLAMALGASDAAAPRMLADGFAVVALLVGAYALGQKLLPGIRVAGVLDLDRTAALPRLQDPLGYWNALGAFLAMGIAPMLVTALDDRRRPRLRLGAATAAALMLVTIAFTYSRGAILALAAAVLIIAITSGARLRALLWAGLCVLAAVPASVVGLISAPLTTANVGLSAREAAGAELLVLLAASGLMLVLAGRWVIAHESRIALGEAHRRSIVRAVGATGLAAVIVALVVLSIAGRGLGGNLSHAWHSFTNARATGVSDPSRLLSADSENRWAWWKEAAGAFSARPVQGWGAGSFGVVHLLYRRDILSVQQPHSLPLQFLAETGVIGAALALAALGTLLTTAARTMRGLAGRARGPAAALLAAAVAYTVHSLYDWDWDIPALSIPALAFLGVMIGGDASRGTAARFAAGPRHIRRPMLVRALCGVALIVCLALFAVAVVVPRLAASRAEHALLAVSGTGAVDGRGPLAEALSASRSDPLSGAGLRAGATIALRRDDVVLARGLLASAVRRQPTDGQAWQQLSLVYELLGDPSGALLTARRALALDPRGPVAATVAERALLGLTPPAGSATAVPTSGR